MDTEAIRETLRNEENRLENMRQDLRSTADLDGDSPNPSSSEISVVDNHPADAATDMSQRETDLSILEQVEAELSDVEEAMARLDAGTYGVCEVCGEKIPDERLEAQPATRFCTQHASTHR